MNEAIIRGMISNPVYVGVPPYQRVVSDETWIQAAAQLIAEEGAEQFLVNMLYMLRLSMVEAVPNESIPEDYDGPWLDDGEELPAETGQEENSPSPWLNPGEGFIFCSHDGLPMIILDDNFVCVGEYLNFRIQNSPVTDLITEPILTLIFQNGHTLPLLCPGCGGSLHVTDYSWLLDNLDGLTIVGVMWDEENMELILEFGRAETNKEEVEALEALALHLNSVRDITGPTQAWPYDEDELP
jgi:hypothetical protein